MFKLSFHENGKLQSFELSWKFLAGILATIGVLFSGLLSAIAKAFLILSITIQGLFADPESFYEILSIKKKVV